MEDLALFASQLRQLRQLRGLSQSALAEQVGIPQATLSRYEAGDTEPGLSMVRRLAVFFSVSADTLCGLASPPDTLRPGNWLIDMDVVEEYRGTKKKNQGETFAVAIPERFRIVTSTEYVRIRDELKGKR